MVSAIGIPEGRIADLPEAAGPEIRAGGDSDRATDMAPADTGTYGMAVVRDVPRQVKSGR
ncbi:MULTISPECIES: hypothetical protein [unclassified Methanoregula]|uniref:hypothetical protein n=1 Tax=unclassified Methanoregula TaxID=2649730 RepID=UPI0009D1811B|nr:MULTISPECIES: hypothetical protein [unclassified Methanoregula]OPX64872.1 MAG: hypothetical protein A4E33_00610 [Methanoregula sp. PtaB.Bin085]OPY32924.1 MAG: hypothetical protein A4E34_02301 [Methanoregula sp. PtaU1.Bin006]